MNKWLLCLLAGTLVFTSCKKDDETTDDNTADSGPRLVFRFAFDPTLPRLNNLGQPATMPDGHAGQDPVFSQISAHYVEMSPSMWTQLGAGEVLYHAPETMAGGANAINFDQSILVGEGQDFIAVPLSQVAAGTYEYMRVSLSYQNYGISIRQSGMDFNGRVASFLGFNNYITDYTINTHTETVNDDKLQGYWGFEADVFGTPYVITGQAPEGATTVPNPLAGVSDIPPGSCVVTGAFASPLTITGNETGDIVVTLTLSTNQSFEWQEVNEDGLYEPSAGEQVVDMGLRGLYPTWE